MARKPNNNTTCSRCSSKWFEKVEIAQYPTDVLSVIGQNPTAVLNIPSFFFLRCFTCGLLIESDIYRTANDPLNPIYDDALASMKKRNDRVVGVSIESQIL
jgi:hypothetical protein